MSDAPQTPPDKPRRRLAPVVGLTVIIALASTGWLLRGKSEPVTRQRLEAARKTWLQNEPKNYDLEVVVSGKQGATYAVQVRNGEVIEALRNHAPLKQQRTFRTWSGPGMFDTIETDVDTLEFAKGHPDDPRKIMLTLRAKFDAKTGLPLTYLRSEHGTNHDVSWKVTKFEPK